MLSVFFFQNSFWLLHLHGWQILWVRSYPHYLALVKDCCSGVGQTLLLSINLLFPRKYNFGKKDWGPLGTAMMQEQIVSHDCGSYETRSKPSTQDQTTLSILSPPPPAHPCLHFLGLEFSPQPGPVPLLLILNPSYSSSPDRSTLPSDNRNVLLALSRLSTSCSYQHIDYVTCHSFGCFWSIPCHVPSSLSRSELFANPIVLS